MTSAISHKMHGALEFVRAGVKPREAAQAAGVSLQALYRAMRREKLGQRCPQCGHILTAKHAPTAAGQ